MVKVVTFWVSNHDLFQPPRYFQDNLEEDQGSQAEIGGEG